MNALSRLSVVLLLVLIGLLQPLSFGSHQASSQRVEQPKDQTVYVTRRGKRYHREGCRYLATSKLPITLREAKQNGYTPCKVCHPPQ